MQQNLQSHPSNSSTHKSCIICIKWIRRDDKSGVWNVPLKPVGYRTHIPRTLLNVSLFSTKVEYGVSRKCKRQTVAAEIHHSSAAICYVA